MITQRVKSRSYPTMRAFDMEMTSLFEKGRRYYEAGSKEYGDILALQVSRLTLPGRFCLIPVANYSACTTRSHRRTNQTHSYPLAPTLPLLRAKSVLLVVRPVPDVLV